VLCVWRGDLGDAELLPLPDERLDLVWVDDGSRCASCPAPPACRSASSTVAAWRRSATGLRCWRACCRCSGCCSSPAPAAAHGLVVPFGDSPTVGVGGITLGGGVGWLSRKLGLTIDSVAGVEIVTADGQHLTADEQTRPDLFWAVRGGGGNFGVVTRFRY
jgi:FAD binding domain